MSKDVKKIKEVVRLQLKLGEVTPTPPLGPILGSRGINLGNFCKQFNNESMNVTNLEKGTLVTVLVTIFEDKSFFFVIKSPPTTYLIKKYLNVEKGYALHKNENPIIVSDVIVRNIIEIKKNDLMTLSLTASKRIIIGTIKSMGFCIEEKGAYEKE